MAQRTSETARDSEPNVIVSLPGDDDFKAPVNGNGHSEVAAIAAPVLSAEFAGRSDAELRSELDTLREDYLKHRGYGKFREDAHRKIDEAHDRAKHAHRDQVRSVRFRATGGGGDMLPMGLDFMTWWMAQTAHVKQLKAAIDSPAERGEVDPFMGSSRAEWVKVGDEFRTRIAALETELSEREEAAFLADRRARRTGSHGS